MMPVRFRRAVIACFLVAAGLFVAFQFRFRPVDVRIFTREGHDKHGGGGFRPPNIIGWKSTQTGLVIIGSGPTGLGAAKRYFDVCRGRDIIILEELGQPGGLASSVRDEKGFLWDVGVHVVFSHYTYFDRVLNRAVLEWNYRRRASFAYMMGSDGTRRFIPYPVQNNIHLMDKESQQRSLKGLEEIAKHPIQGKPTNFDEWLLHKFGKGLSNVFMRKYNTKIWTVNTTEMNSVWVGERVAVPDVKEIKSKIKETEAGIPVKDSDWGPNRYFRYPKFSGTGGIWQAVARQLPEQWFKFHTKVTGINIDKKEITTRVGDDATYVKTYRYSKLVSTVPLNVFTGFLNSKDLSLKRVQELASQLVYTHTHIVGIGLKGTLPKNLADKSWVYFPDSDAPFYRVTMFSNYSDDHVPKPGFYWSLMCEIAQPQNSENKVWAKEYLVEETVKILALYGFIRTDMVVSKHYRRLDHGYPVPTISRDAILDQVQPWLESKGIFSRGRFGGWRYEVANQDHSFMQGVEAMDKILSGTTEITYPHPNYANSKKNTDRVVPLENEYVIAHHKEDLNWLRPCANQTLIYHKGNDLGPPFQLYAWERLPNVGREAHTFLYHITTYYDRLANVTMFAKGSNLSGTCLRPLEKFIPLAKMHVQCRKRDRMHTEWGSFKFPQGYLAAFQRSGIPLRRSNRTFVEYYKYLFRRPPPQEGIRYCRNACFGATRETIRKHPLDLYQRALRTLSEFSNQEEAHYMKMLWYHLFE